MKIMIAINFIKVTHFCFKKFENNDQANGTTTTNSWISLCMLHTQIEAQMALLYDPWSDE